MPEDALARATALLAVHPVVDGHNDLPWDLRERVAYDLDALDISEPQPELHTDIARLRAGGVGGQFWSVYVPSTWSDEESVRATREQIACVRAPCARYRDTFERAYPALIADLLDRGWPDDDRALLTGGNVLRVLRDAASEGAKG